MPVDQGPISPVGIIAPHHRTNKCAACLFRPTALRFGIVAWSQLLTRARQRYYFAAVAVRGNRTAAFALNLSHRAGGSRAGSLAPKETLAAKRQQQLDAAQADFCPTSPAVVTTRIGA